MLLLLAFIVLMIVFAQKGLQMAVTSVASSLWSRSLSWETIVEHHQISSNDVEVADFIHVDMWIERQGLSFGTTLPELLSESEPVGREAFYIIVQPRHIDGMDLSTAGLYRYPVTICGSSYCAYDESALELIPDDEQRYAISCSSSVNPRLVFGFRVREEWMVCQSSENLITKVGYSLSRPAINPFDRALGELENRSSVGYWFVVRERNLYAPLDFRE
ncbi:hypothetical protein GTA62_17565 [Roseobacter sp. HKCCD9010]|uniref:hypothetical protein n=1 Tax=unclassified Roseobacter TaxID=196798 RepID=UPI0014908F0D|nr:MULTISPECIES: hypothetical protein [unclassified Roseobacter]MBF9051887.1 hypothetical protein [Rhodobacterales bacterium HKCCD4356]NNV13880.1 hypothetical protein [Roseobacter sp. HKCCD7357]NNV17905.1 hypothetical protein [Roseobacter sp. HKCCD8768]NNV27512.1 hypothetical protein [Roseobacter sp. HKCCD8192]NNV31632.1 hypothetical protein [Roseobacter sp. HKCCD9061]